MSNFKQTVAQWLADLSRDRQALVIVDRTMFDAKKVAVDAVAGHKTASIKATDLEQDSKPLRTALRRRPDVLIVGGRLYTQNGLAMAKRLITERQVPVARNDHDGSVELVDAPKLIFCIAQKDFLTPDAAERRFRVLFAAAQP